MIRPSRGFLVSVAQIRKNNTQRVFYVLEQLHTLPNINYLAKVRNVDEVIPKSGESTGEHAREKEKESVTPQHKPAETH